MIGLPIEKFHVEMDSDHSWYYLISSTYFEFAMKAPRMAVHRKAVLCQRAFVYSQLRGFFQDIELLETSDAWALVQSRVKLAFGDREDSIARVAIFRLALICQFWIRSVEKDLAKVTERTKFVLPMLQEICTAAERPAEYVHAIYLNAAYELIGLVCGDKYEWLQELKRERSFWKALARRANPMWAWPNDDFRLHRPMRPYLQLATEARGMDFVTAEPQLHAALAELSPDVIDREWIRSYGLCQ
jgi:hypothetical protein